MIGYALAAIGVFLAWLGMVVILVHGIGKAIGLRDKRH